MRGITVGLGLNISKEEFHIITNHFDKDGDARVTYQEFSSKISIKDVAKQSERYMISIQYFTDQLLCCWYQMKNDQHNLVRQKLTKYDTNND